MSSEQMTRIATVVAVRRFPVKSMASDEVRAIDVEREGVRHDRSFAVVDADGSVVTAAQAPQLRALVASMAEQDDDVARVRIDGTSAGDGAGPDGDVDARLSDLVGRPVRLAAVDPAGQLDAPVHLVSRQAVDAALRGEHDVADCACSLEEPRANIEIDLHAVGNSGNSGNSGDSGDAKPDWEHGWVGRTVDVGQARLVLHRRPGHCLGVYAQVVRPGRVQVGDPVSLAR